MIAPEQLSTWVKDVIAPIEEAKYRKKSNTEAADPNQEKIGRMQSVRNWIFGRKQETNEEAALANAQAAAASELIEESKEGPADGMGD